MRTCFISAIRAHLHYLEDHTTHSTRLIPDLTHFCKLRDPSPSPHGLLQAWPVTYHQVQVFAIAGVILVTVSVDYGIGSHQNDLSESDAVAAIKWGWINQLLSILATSLGKLAIVAFLQQIHGPEHRGRVIGLWALATSNLIVNAITVGMIMTQCSPREKLWNENLEGSCDGRQRNEDIAYFQGSKYSANSCLSVVKLTRFLDLRLVCIL